VRLDDLRHALREEARETESWELPRVARTAPKRPGRGLTAVALVAAAVVAVLVLPGLLAGTDTGRDIGPDAEPPAATTPQARLTELAWEPAGAVCQAVLPECLAPLTIRTDDGRLRRTFLGESDPLSEDPGDPAYRLAEITEAPPVVYALVGAVGNADGELRIDPGFGTPLVRPASELHLLRVEPTSDEFTVEVTERNPRSGERLVTAFYEAAG
jgi:hypothetical protein